MAKYKSKIDLSFFGGRENLDVIYIYKGESYPEEYLEKLIGSHPSKWKKHFELVEETEPAPKAEIPVQSRPEITPWEQCNIWMVDGLSLREKYAFLNLFDTYEARKQEKTAEELKKMWDEALRKTDEIYNIIRGK